MNVIAIFDIGKTNKKFFLFDERLNVVHTEYQSFEEITDDDGYPCDDLSSMVAWMKEVLANHVKAGKYDIKAVNFSTYGASFVHIDEEGQPVTELYNYLKPIPEDCLQSFYDKHGEPETIAHQTGSPSLEMLNSGLQLYYLKYCKPELFKKVKWSLHFPQYLSYIFTGLPISEFTSIGCHTALWDFENTNYHKWAHDEGIDKILPPITGANSGFLTEFEGKMIRFGAGIHDSSSALVPYLVDNEDPFILVSTGTWSITINPFSQSNLTASDLSNDCLNFMRKNGATVRAARLFLGQEYSHQVSVLTEHFNADKDDHKKVQFDLSLAEQYKSEDQHNFKFEHIKLNRQQPAQSNLSQFSTFNEAFHCLMVEMVELQINCINLALKGEDINTIYIDGGFIDNDVYMKLLRNHFSDKNVQPIMLPIGSALGAAMDILEHDKQIEILSEYFHEPVA